MIQKELIKNAVERRLQSRRETESTKQVIEGFFEYCNYDTDRVTFDFYCEYVSNKDVRYQEAIFARRIIRYIAVDELGISKDLWPGWNVPETIIKSVDIEKEVNEYISLDEWEAFSNDMETILKDINKRGFYKRYLILCFSWYGVYSSTIGKLEKKDIEVEEDKVIVHLKEKDIYIKDRCAIDGMNKIYSHKNLQTYVIGRAERFTKQQITELKSRCNSKVLDKNLNNIYVSGELYRLSFGEKPNIGKDNTYLMPYYEAMSRFLYGEPLDSSEPLSSGEPLDSGEPQINVEKEAENYILGWQWERFASQAELMIGIAKLHRLEPFFEYYLAWNGIPVELIKLLTPKNISTNGEDRIYITDGRHEIEIESSKNIALKLQDFILVAGDKVFEEIHGYTEDNLAFAFFGARDFGFTNTVEEIYISGILYRLAKFGQEPDDKENLNYYKAVADYMYKGDD